ncbi:MAG: 2-iminoacetate synthase ThiH [Proteobacteria bacterium]|nr:2-iminoacetate synthase ThiH [Pseudomonadota bacterium]MBU1649546.1 2-iminoacetate synthase ThiH [Pseudomonadota bacterium]MBU1986053.1 2-iminoacetate synthase ThiH [Pseudomonadota bacterium]
MTLFSLPEFQQLQQTIQHCTSTDVEQALTSRHPGILDLAALISPAAEPFMEEMARRSALLTAQRFGRTIQLYAPIYLSNYCTNRCAYCGFSADNRIARRCLTFDEAEAEADILHKRGFQHILLVSGEAESAVDVEYLETIALRLRGRFAAVSIEVQPLSTAHYARLFKAGITAVAVYQETYDQEMYKQVHLSGKKTDYHYRLETPARVAAAGMREVGIGALLGLTDWRAEGLAIGLHLAWLRKNFWSTGVTVSFPRLRPAAGAFSPLVPVSEKNLSQLIFGLRLFDPDVGLVLSTREEARYRDGMLGLGPTRYSAGSCTAPGGYSHPDLTDGEQFSVGDLRTMEEVSLAIAAKGCDPVSKDWDSAFQN